MIDKLKAPFPYFGGKSRIAPRIWELLGNVNAQRERLWISPHCQHPQPELLLEHKS